MMPPPTRAFLHALAAAAGSGLFAALSPPEQLGKAFGVVIRPSAPMKYLLTGMPRLAALSSATV
jgi:hypothetical protein